MQNKNLKLIIYIFKKEDFLLKYTISDRILNFLTYISYLKKIILDFGDR